MNRFCWTTGVLLLCLQICDVQAEDYKTTMLRKGLPAKVTVKVCDSEEKPVTNVTVVFCFAIHNRREPNTVVARTDADGMATGEANANEIVTIHLDKEGHYWSFVEYGLWGPGKGYQTGRWEPWNPTVEVVLREKKRPQRNYRRGSETAYHLTREGLYGFDLLANKVVEPGSKDGHADFYFVKPASYYIRMFWDLDSDGEWDTGLYDTHTPAEAIWYYTQPIEMRENWDYNQDWDPLAIPVDKQKPDELKKTKSEKKEKKSKNQQREEEKRKKAAGVSSGSGSNFGF